MYPQDSLAVERFEDVGLNNILPIVRSPDNQHHSVVVFHHIQHKNHQKGNGASHCSHHIVTNTAADTSDDRPKNVNAVAAVFAGGREADDEKYPQAHLGNG